MSDELLLEEQVDGILLLTLNRPEVMNALNFPLLKALEKKIDEVRFDRNIRVVIITGAQSRAFCGGADLKERATMSPVEVERFIYALGRLFNTIEQLPIPVIAAVNGMAFGGGTELALAADIRIAASSATMGLTETRLAIIPGGGGTQRLPRLVGKGKAKELIFTGRRIGAEEALSIGLVNQVAPFEELLPQCRKMAEMICE
ncbi:MAG: enoyl-CoA hydratase-related protein, partial [Desulfobacteraceae bacterium]